MKKLFFFFSLIITISASAQTYPWISVHNYQRHDGLWPSRLLALPSDTVTNKQIGSIAYLDGVTYIKNLFSWDPLALSGTGGGGDGAGPLTLQNVINNGNQFDRSNILRGNGYDLFIDSIDNFTVNANNFYVPSLRSGESTNQFITTNGFGGFTLKSIEFPVDTSGFAGTQDLQSTIDYGNRFRHNNTIHAVGHDFYIDSLGNYSTFSGHTATFDNQIGAYTEIHQDSANAYQYAQSHTGLNISEVRTHQDSAHFQSYDSLGNNARFTAFGKGTLNSYASIADSMNSPKIVFGDANYKNSDTTKVLATTSNGDVVFKTLYSSNPALPCYGVLQPGYVTGSGSGLTVNVTAAIYRINCVTYNSGAGSVTLSTADATNPRYDVVYVDNTGSIGVITGTASANPSIPQVDPATQIELTSIFVDAGATSLPITDQVIYDENTEAWTGTATGVTANFTNTLNVQHGTKSADVGSWTTGQQLNFTKNSGTITATDYSIETFYIKLKVALASTANIRVSFLNGTTVVSNVVTLGTGQGFTKTSTAYQTIAIPISAFTFTSTTVNKVRITLVGTGGGLYLDYLRLQSGVVTTTTETDPIADAKTVTITPGIGMLGSVSTQTLINNPSFTTNIDTFAISTRAWRQKLADSLGAIIGTKQASLTGSQGDMIYFSATNALASLAKSTTAHQFISSDGTSNNPLYETINSDWLTEGSTNKFYTDARARAAISLSFTTTGTSGAATGSYDNTTGIFSINVPQYTSGGGSGTPGGSNTQLQYNNSGAFGGTSGATTDGTNIFIPTLNGSSSSGGNLTLNSTTNATKGKIFFGANSAYDGVNTRLGIGTTSPSYGIVTSNSDATQAQFLSTGTTSGTTGGFLLATSKGTPFWSIGFRTNQDNGWFEMTDNLGNINRRWHANDDLMSSGGVFGWSSETNFATAGVGARDLGLSRASANTLKVTNGSTGLGNVNMGALNATTASTSAVQGTFLSTGTTTGTTAGFQLSTSGAGGTAYIINFQTNQGKGWFEMTSSAGAIQRRWNANDDLMASGGVFGWSSETNFATAGTGARDLGLSRAAANILSITNGSTGVGKIRALVLDAGTTAAGRAPLKLTSGTNLTTPEAGAVEFDGTNYFATSSTTRYTLAKTLTNTATLDFTSTTSGTSSDLTITVTGASDGDVVYVGVPNASVNANTSFSAWVSTSNTVTVRFNNYSSGAVDPASGTFRVSVIKY
jgi:hypothetical protein